ncbi:MAG: type II toxin-antitoxin system VapC family toxin [Hyphomicrobiales bacterium]|nr:type II toxin-antitoxin system VapC family toxin [Hyphomicrobiales bacterium]MBV9974778.1 type II toxin-antitoxin system VapC family toxin [Hyphomicrobiales bacterium]
MILIDTNVISAAMRENPDHAVLEWFDKQAATSVWTTAIIILEIRFGLSRMPAGRRRARREQVFDRALGDDIQNRVRAFDQTSADSTATLMARCELQGRGIELRDAMIAGIVLTRSAALATRNTKHFENLEIVLINRWAN